MKNLKRLLRVALMCCIIVGATPLSADAGWYGSAYGDIQLELSDGTLFINVDAETNTGSVIDFEMNEGIEIADVDIPSEVNGVTITSIGKFSTWVPPFFEATIGNLHIPYTVKNVVSNAFSDCSISSITVDRENVDFLSLDGVLFSKDSKTLYRCPTSKAGSYQIPDGTISINESAFENCQDLTDVVIPYSVKSIGASAFAYCNSISNLVIPYGVTKIEYGTFWQQHLKSIFIPETVTYIEKEAFGSSAYGKELHVFYQGSEEQWNGIYIYGYGNGALSEAEKHYNCPVPDVPINDVKYKAVYFLLEYDPTPRMLTFGNGTNVTKYTLSDSTNDSVIRSQLLNQYVLVTCEADPDNVMNYTVTDIQPVTSAVGTVTASGNQTLTIDGATYPVSEDLVLGFYENERILYHTYNGTIMGFSEVEESHGELQAWDAATGTLTIDGTAYATNFLTDLSFLADLDSRLNLQYYFTTATTGGYTVLLEIGDEYSKEYTGPKVINGEFTFLGSDNSDRTYSYTYNDAWFAESAYEEQPDLMSMSIRVAMASFKKDNLKKLLNSSNLTFVAKNSDFHYPDPSGNDTIGYSFAYKTIQMPSGEPLSIVLVAVRGGDYGEEWGGNFRIGTGTNHEGFERAANQVLYGTTDGQVAEGLIDYLERNQNNLAEGNTKIWICGYSRAAATSNLVAAALDDGLIDGIEPSDVFAYCFECPQPTSATNRKDAKYNNIKNVVNPIDLVPKVTMTAWNYGRYGKDYYTLCQEMSFQYLKNKKAMQNEYQKLLNYGNNGGGNATDYTEEAIAQASILDQFTNNLALAAGNKFDYKVLMEDGIMDLAAKTAGGNGGRDVNWISVLLTVPRLGPVMGAFAWNTGNVVANFSKIALSHYPELCMSWVDAWAAGTTAASFSAKYRRVYTKCPVDVAVYDSGGNLVGQIVNNEVVEIEGGVAAYVDDANQKVFVLPTDEEFDVRILATADGTVNYEVTEYDAAAYETTKVVSYQNVAIETGDELVGTVELLEEGTEATYPLYLSEEDKENNEAVAPTVVQTGEEVVEYTVTVVSEGGDAVGGGTYVIGEHTKVTAIETEGYTFDGWYVGDELITEDLEYRFLVDGDIELTARWTYVGSSSSSSSTSSGSTSGGNSSGGSTSSGSFVDTHADNCPSLAYTDVDTGAWYHESVDYVLANGLMSGYGNGSFGPTDELSRAMLCQVLYNSVYTTVFGYDAGFTDVTAGTWYEDAVNWAAYEGIVTGYGDGRFGPDDPITREQLAVILWRYSGEPAASGALDSFTDAAGVSDWASDALAWAVERGIVTGKGNGILDPQGRATRAETATMLMRYLTDTAN